MYCWGLKYLITQSASDMSKAVPRLTQKSYSFKTAPPPGLGLHGSITVN